jgi:hypothetical protein
MSQPPNKPAVICCSQRRHHACHRRQACSCPETRRMVEQKSCNQRGHGQINIDPTWPTGSCRRDWQWQLPERSARPAPTPPAPLPPDPISFPSPRCELPPRHAAIEEPAPCHCSCPPPVERASRCARI